MSSACCAPFTHRAVARLIWPHATGPSGPRRPPSAASWCVGLPPGRSAARRVFAAHSEPWEPASTACGRATPVWSASAGSSNDECRPEMTPLPDRPRHLRSSPFQADPEPLIEQFESGDLVSHDSYGMGRVVSAEANAVIVDFRTQTVRIPSPYSKMTKL